VPRKKKEKQEEKIEIPPNASPELVEQQIEKVIDQANPVEEIPNTEGEWGTFKDVTENSTVETAETTLDEAEVSTVEDEHTAEKAEIIPEKPKGQLRLDGTPIKTVVDIYIKPQAVPYELRTDKFKLNTTQEGYENRRDTDRAELTQWVAKKVKVLKDSQINPGDFDKHVEKIVDAIKGLCEVRFHQVGEDED
jgi:hypothetical protein